MPDNIIKVLVIGDYAVGKTQLINRISNNAFSKIYQTTIGIDFKLYKLKKDKINVQFWDMGELGIDGDIPRIYFEHTNIIMLVADATKSFADNLLFINNFLALNSNKIANIKAVEILLVFNKDDEVTFKLADEQFDQLKQAMNISREQVFICSARANLEEDGRISLIKNKLEDLSKKALKKTDKEEKDDRGPQPHLSKLDILKQQIRDHIKIIDDPVISAHLKPLVKKSKYIVLITAGDFLNGFCSEHDVCVEIIRHPEYLASTGRSKTKKLVRLALEFKGQEITGDLNISTLINDISAHRRKIIFSFFGSAEVKSAKLEALQKCSEALMNYQKGYIYPAGRLVDEIFKINGFSQATFWSNTWDLVNQVKDLVTPDRGIVLDC